MSVNINNSVKTASVMQWLACSPQVR